MGDLGVCRVVGELDSFGAGRLREVLSTVVESPRVVLDLGEMTFIDSAGLGVIVGAVRRIRELGGAVGLCTRRPAILRVLQLAGFDRIVPLTATVPEATARLTPLATAKPAS